MTKYTPASFLQSVSDTPTPYLDTLDPESFVRELSDIIENLAIEFDTVKLRIDVRNIPMVSDMMLKGMQLRGFEFPPGDIPFPDRLKTMALSGYASIEISLPRAHAFEFARDLHRGMAGLDAERASPPP